MMPISAVRQLLFYMFWNHDSRSSYIMFSNAGGTAVVVVIVVVGVVVGVVVVVQVVVVVLVVRRRRPYLPEHAENSRLLVE